MIVSYFDGKSSRVLSGELTPRGKEYNLRDLETNVEYLIDRSYLEISRGREEVILTHGELELHLSLEQFQSLNLKLGILGKDQNTILKSVGILACVGLLIFYSYKPLLNALVPLIPDSVFDSMVSELKTKFKASHCLKPDQQKALDALFARLGRNTKDYEVYVIASKDINAFAMPGKLIVINDELIKAVSSAEALAGVVAHEIAHIEKEHIKIAFIKQNFLEIFWTLAFNQGADVFKVMASSLFSQEEEKEADLVAAQMLQDQSIHPQGVVQFFEMMEKKEKDSYLKYLIFSHPGYPNRIKLFKQTYDTYPVLSPQDWDSLKPGCVSK